MLLVIMGEVDQGPATSNAASSPLRVVISPEDLSALDKALFMQHWYNQEQYLNCIESKLQVAQSGEERR